MANYAYACETYKESGLFLINEESYPGKHTNRNSLVPGECSPLGLYCLWNSSSLVSETGSVREEESGEKERQAQSFSEH